LETEELHFSPAALFCFPLGSVAIELCNNLHEPDDWYMESDGTRPDLESFLERHFPKEVPSESHLVRFLEARFPSRLFQEM
jgi:hypothetical protein